MAEQYVQKEHISQDITELDRTLAADRWLLDVGLVTTSVQHNLIMHGFLSSSLVDDVDAGIDVGHKTIKFNIGMTPAHYRKYARFRVAWHKYAAPRTLWQKWRRLALLRKSVYLNMEDNLRKMVSGYLPSYAIEISVTQMSGPSTIQVIKRFIKKWLTRKKKQS